jgi:hypothetical protein
MKTAKSVGTADTNQDRGQQGVDKEAMKEKTKKEIVTTKDLKGKKVDADPTKESDQPIDI